jgi:hypothetical protein
VRAASHGHKQALYVVREARGTRAELQELLLKGVVPALLRLALDKKQSATKQWAGELLASIAASLGKYDGKLSKVNAAYLQGKKKIVREKQFVQVVVSPKPIMETTRRELKKAEDHRRTLLRLKGVCGRTWIQSANQQGIKDYLPFVKLPEFPGKLERWWKVLWPLIKKNNPDLLSQLRGGKFSTRGVRYQARWASYRKEFSNALRTLARLRSGGVL